MNNAKNLEPVFFCWLGNTPLKVIMAVLCRNVPVLGPEHQSMVSVAGMIGTPHDDDAEEKAKLQREAAAEPGQEETPDEKAASAERNLVAACLRKRKIGAALVPAR